MTERERLIELLKAADEDSARRCITDYNEAIADNADYILANGVIVPPCKVGSTIYMLVTKRPRVYCEPYTMIQKSKVTFGNLERVIRDFGKTVFFTREEAEKALEGKT